MPSLPFFVFAPHTFVHDILTSQLHRGTSGLDALSISQRLVMISGISGLPNINATTGLAVGLAIGLAALAALVYSTTWRRRSRLDWFILVATVIVIARNCLLTRVLRPLRVFSGGVSSRCSWGYASVRWSRGCDRVRRILDSHAGGPRPS